MGVESRDVEAEVEGASGGEAFLEYLEEDASKTRLHSEKSL